MRNDALQRGEAQEQELRHAYEYTAFENDEDEKIVKLIIREFRGPFAHPDEGRSDELGQQRC